MTDLSAHDENGLRIVTVASPRIDAASAIQFKDRMREVTSGWAGRVLLDLGQVNFIDSSGLGAIVAAMKQLDDSQTLELACLTPSVDKVFRLTRMDTIFAIHGSIGEASDDTLRRAHGH